MVRYANTGNTTFLFCLSVTLDLEKAPVWGSREETEGTKKLQDNVKDLHLSYHIPPGKQERDNRST